MFMVGDALHGMPCAARWAGFCALHGGLVAMQCAARWAGFCAVMYGAMQLPRSRACSCVCVCVFVYAGTCSPFDTEVVYVFDDLSPVVEKELVILSEVHFTTYFNPLFTTYFTTTYFTTFFTIYCITYCIFGCVGLIYIFTIIAILYYLDHLNKQTL